MSNNKTYNIPISWESYKTIPVEAENLQEAVEKALKQFLSEPDETYIDDSFLIDGIVEENYPDESFDLDKAIENL